MKCPNCKQEIKFVRRFLVYEVGDAYPIDDEGRVDIHDTSFFQKPGSETEMREFADGEEGVWCECPLCGGNVPDMNEDEEDDDYLVEDEDEE